LIHFEGRRYQEFRYREKVGDKSFNFMKRKVSIHEKEIKTIGSWGLVTVDMASETCKFMFWKDNQANFEKHEIMK
jgi:hypothetical protein